MHDSMAAACGCLLRATVEVLHRQGRNVHPNRLRVAAVLRDYGMNEREQAPADSRAVHGG